MCANDTPATARSSPFLETGRSFLSRLTNPLKSRARNLTDFHIRPEEPHRHFSPGDLVKGAVVLSVVKPIRITHLTVRLHGSVRVFKRPNTANEPLPVDAGLTTSGNVQKSEYFGNGHASLFQDEQILCGEGRLNPGVYEFNFELEFPSKGLPTSIDFERGTISYMITSTITRPNTISATSTCNHKISFVETIDIGPMNPPRPRTIFLEPISRRTRRRKTVQKRVDSSIEAKDTESSSEVIQPPRTPLPDESASQRGSVDHNSNPRSTVISDAHRINSVATSAESTTSGSTSFRLGPAPSLVLSARDRERDSRTSLTNKTITANIELLKSGCLAGDNLPLKISVKHNKPIKSLHGIIITLYRQGRIDSAPPLYLLTDSKGKDAENFKHEDYYPKSKTGLGGLSLSSAGSSSLFRKDLSQTFAPLIIDPTTLTAEVTASVRVPENVFPTIKGLPGDMISFKYLIEVVLDLGGKLAGQQRHLPRVGAVSLPSNYGISNPSVNSNMLAAWGGSIVDTDNIRREKSVVACLFEVVVGSTDSIRKRGRGGSAEKRQGNGWPDESSVKPRTLHDPIYEELSMPNSRERSGSGEGQYADQEYYHENYQGRCPGYNGNEGFAHEEHDWYPEEQPPAHIRIPTPFPGNQGDEGLTEKERIRRAEERLLPSQPPLDFQSPSSSRALVPQMAPSPHEHEEEDLYGTEDTAPYAAPNGFSDMHNADSLSGQHHCPSAPVLKDLGQSSLNNSSEDKEELECKRLLAEASAPFDFIRDEDGNADDGRSPAQHEPSAPNLSEEEEYSGHYGHPSVKEPSTFGERLPNYER